MQPDVKKIDSTDDLAADLLRLAQKPKKAMEGEGSVSIQPLRPSLRGSIAKQPFDDAEDEQITQIAVKVARGHKGFTSAQDALPEKIEMERLTLAIPAATGQDLAEKAAKSRVTKTYLILKALKEAGFDVPMAALIPDGRSRRT